MKTSLLKSIGQLSLASCSLAAAFTGFYATLNIPSWAQTTNNQPGFFCAVTSNGPVTVYQNRQGGQEPWIRWVSNTFASAGYDPLTRCREVSGRLENFRVKQQLKFITVGVINRQPVVCTASEVNGRCQGLIFTLKPGQDAVRTLNNLLTWRDGLGAVPSLRESDAIPYINVQDRLDGNLVPNPKPDTTPVKPQTPQPGTGSTREL